MSSEIQAAPSANPIGHTSSNLPFFGHSSVPLHSPLRRPLVLASSPTPFPATSLSPRLPPARKKKKERERERGNTRSLWARLQEGITVVRIKAAGPKQQRSNTISRQSIQARP